MNIRGTIAFVSVLCTSAPIVWGQASVGTTTDGGASSTEKVLVPDATWNCGMGDGIPKPESGILLLKAEVKLDEVYDVGNTPYGQRQVAVTQAGIMRGPKIEAAVLPGGLDFQLMLPNGVVEVEQILVLRTGDGKYAIMRNAGTGASGDDVRIVYDFESPGAGAFEWLNTGRYVGRRVIDSAAKTMKLSIYVVSSVAAVKNGDQAVRIVKPADVPPQPWDYRKAAKTEQRGETIVTEIVTLGGSQQVGASKRGARNIIPITSGTLTGNITGKVLFGGADYQSPTSGPAIDARYLWQTTDGDIIIVRNAGGFNGLVPTFETRAEGKYSWLNRGTYLSSPPGFGAGGLQISMYKSQ